VLVHRPRDGDRLEDRNLGERAEKCVELAARRAVALDLPVRLLEDERRRERERNVARVLRSEKSAENEHAFRMDRSAELDLPLDVDDLAAPEPHARRDPARAAEREAAEL